MTPEDRAAIDTALHPVDQLVWDRLIAAGVSVDVAHQVCDDLVATIGTMVELVARLAPTLAHAEPEP